MVRSVQNKNKCILLQNPKTGKGTGRRHENQSCAVAQRGKLCYDKGYELNQYNV